jgi:hypothetical protein
MSNSIYNPFSPLRHINPRASGLMTFKGGGGAETVESIPDWYKPFVETAAAGAQSAYDSGDLSKVAGFNEAQTAGLSGLAGAAGEANKQYDVAKGATGVLQQAAQGGGMFGEGATQALRDKAIRDSQKAYAPVGAQMATQGAIGGARSGILQADRDAGLASALAEVDYGDLNKRRDMSTGAAQSIIGNTGAMQDAAGAGAGYLGEAGGYQQEQTQREGDAAYQGLQRLGGLLSGAPVPQQGPSGGK